jgi:dTDP-4-dehydrorhamnose reductase
MPRPLLLIGGDSEIAVATARHLAALDVPFVATTRRRERVSAEQPLLDLAEPLGDWLPPSGTRAACIFAAVARLQACEADPPGSSLINVTNTIALAGRLLQHGVAVVFLSTNQVFDGSVPCVPADAPHCPVSAYGQQKARTEAALLQQIANGAPVAILRLAKIVSPGMALLRQWMAALAAGQPVAAFADMMLAPVPAELAATAIAKLLLARDGARGIFQLSGPRDVSYTEIAVHLAGKTGADPALVGPVPAASAGMPPGATPAHTTLDSTALRERFGITVPDPWAVIDALVGE